MPLQLRWVGTEDLERVAETRWMCYSHARKELPRFEERLQLDPWGRPGDYLLAERDGQPVGTATSLPMKMWIRGACFPCQGVAWVGTVKSARRRGGNEPGVASAVMTETLRIARERENVLSALMPFRVSFYEHFGYGVVERRTEWTIPLSTIPHRDCTGWRFAAPEDRDAQVAEWQRAVQAGQCDIERTAARWNLSQTFEEEGMVFVDRPHPIGEIPAFAFVMQETVDGRTILKIEAWSTNGPDAFARMLAFFATMRDQCSSLKITTPATWQINRILREAQIAHRPVDHAVSESRTCTRMQMRILDHKKYLESIHWPGNPRGKLTVAIAESEGNISRLAIDVDSGKAKVTPAPTTSTAAADYECTDRQWAAIATGDISASTAARWGLAKENNPTASALLDALSAGPTPFCREYF